LEKHVKAHTKNSKMRYTVMIPAKQAGK
jgi:hypothetical protein